MSNLSKINLVLMMSVIVFLVIISQRAESALSQSIQAPEFTLEDSLNQAISLSDFKGQPVVLHFWATWCPYCKKLQPGLEQLRRLHEGTDLVILGISILEDEGANPAAVLKNNGIGFSTLINGDEVAERYGVRGTPTTVFINRNGEIVWMTNISAPHDPNLAQAIEFILKQ